ncbi:serine/threonine-protein kinase dkf-2-like isoform X3 [Ranitomeya variabilis]|uniref:serine/threonine-protein kinase dkf-2-like isoform X3 n=1 Tax=Ranitomeya variabilis TaxID=490064 RepID=UPI0040565D50
MDILNSIRQWESQDGSATIIPDAGQAMSHNDLRKTMGFIFWDIHEEKSDDNLRIVHISSNNENEWKLAERFCAITVICSSHTSVAPRSSLRRFLDFCSRTYGPEKMIMMICGMEDNKSEKRKIAEWEVEQSPRCPLLTLTIGDMKLMNKSEVKDICIDRIMVRKVHQMRDILKLNTEGSKNEFAQAWSRLNKPVIGIFSREGESQYSWLVNALIPDPFKDNVPKFRPCFINNEGSQQFCEVVSQCTFAILYHSRPRTCTSMTTVMGSLYDKELDHLSSRLEQKVHIDESCVLGKGSFGTVYKGLFNGTTAAIKKVTCEENMRKHILLEVVLTMKLQHPNIVKCLAATERDGAILLVLEYIPGANLHDVLHKQECPIKLSEADKISVCLDVLSAVDYAHSRNIIHQDIKPGNILIKEETKKALLTDWGAANIRITIDSTMERSERIGPQGGGTYLYMAPERFLNRLSRSTKMSDMWSVGATFVQLFTNRLPWEHLEEMNEQIRKNKLPRTLDFLPKNVDSIIKGSMSFKPEQRLTANAMLSAMKEVKIMPIKFLPLGFKYS